MKLAAFTAIALAIGMPVVHASETAAMNEANALQVQEGKEAGRQAYSPGHGVEYKASYHVFIKSALAVDFTYRKATATLPLYRGKSPDGKDVFYILTDASDFRVAQRMGLNYAPKLANAIGSDGVQNVTVNDGIMQFQGAVDFAPVYKVVAGDSPGTFRPRPPTQVP